MSYHSGNEDDSLDHLQVIYVASEQTLGLQALHSIQVTEAGHQPGVAGRFGELGPGGRLTPQGAGVVAMSGQGAGGTTPHQPDRDTKGEWRGTCSKYHSKEERGK